MEYEDEASTEWWAKEMQKLRELRKEIVKTACSQNTELEVTSHGAKTNRDGKHKIRLNFQVEGQSFQEFCQKSEYEEYFEEDNSKCPACGTTGQKESTADCWTCTNDNCGVWYFGKEEVRAE